MKIKIKLRWKIFVFSLAVYVVSLCVIGVIITENNYNDSLKKEVKNFLDKEKNILMSAALYIKANEQLSNHKIDIERYSTRLVDMFHSDNYEILMYNESMDLKAATFSFDGLHMEEAVGKALEGEKTYQIKWIGNKHYIFITDVIKIENQELIMVLADDISGIDMQRKEQYQFFSTVGIIGFLIAAAIIGIMTKVFIKPIEHLKEATGEIARGNYHKRIEMTQDDELGQLAEQFNRMADEVEKRIGALQEESQRKQRFIDNLVHELRTPLTSIIGFSDTLMHIKYEQETFHKSLQYIYSEGKRMLSMINQLIELILLREEAFDCKEEEMKPILIEAKELLLEKAKSKNIDVDIVGKNGKKKVNADLLKGVLMNLLDNAINASKDGDKITMGMISEIDKDCIFVKDQGIGMDEEHIQYVLEPYYRIDRARSRTNGGAGLGLSICNEVMKKHGGKIEIESKLGEGTTIKIIFYNSDTN
ncbi:MAG: sensor histidine kinase [Bacillota bacterium]